MPADIRSFFGGGPPKASQSSASLQKKEEVYSRPTSHWHETCDTIDFQPELQCAWNLRRNLSIFLMLDNEHNLQINSLIQSTEACCKEGGT
jgi:hypothetical protein